MIIARYDVILDQSEHAHLYNHLRNYTKMVLHDDVIIKLKVKSRDQR